MILCLREIKCNSRAYGAMGQSQTPKMERFAKILKGLKHVTTFAKKSSITDIWQIAKYT